RSQAFAATASDDTSMVMAATQGRTHPAAASGVRMRCHSMAPYRLCLAVLPVACLRRFRSDSVTVAPQARLACAAATAVGTAMAIAQGQLMTNKATMTGMA